MIYELLTIPFLPRLKVSIVSIGLSQQKWTHVQLLTIPHENEASNTDANLLLFIATIVQWNKDFALSSEIIFLGGHSVKLEKLGSGKSGNIRNQALTTNKSRKKQSHCQDTKPVKHTAYQCQRKHLYSYQPAEPPYTLQHTTHSRHSLTLAYWRYAYTCTVTITAGIYPTLNRFVLLTQFLRH